MIVRVFLFATFFLLISESAQTQSSSPSVIPELNEPITLDGKIDEPAWKAIEPLPLVTNPG